MSERHVMTVEFEVTESQGLALEAMFEYWTYLGGIGSSRYIAFMVDGDGSFQPRCKVHHHIQNPIPLDDEMRAMAIVKDVEGNKKYDFEPITTLLRIRREGITTDSADAHA